MAVKSSGSLHTVGGGGWAEESPCVPLPAGGIPDLLRQAEGHKEILLQGRVSESEGKKDTGGYKGIQYYVREKTCCFRYLGGYTGLLESRKIYILMVKCVK